jgi:hypothetical protein
MTVIVVSLTSSKGKKGLAFALRRIKESARSKAHN